MRQLFERRVSQGQADVLLVSADEVSIAVEQRRHNRQIAQVSSFRFFKADAGYIDPGEHGKLRLQRIALKVLQLKVDRNSFPFLLRKDSLFYILFCDFFGSLPVFGREKSSSSLNRKFFFGGERDLYLVELAVKLQRLGSETEQIGDFGHGHRRAESGAKVVIVAKKKAPGTVGKFGQRVRLTRLFL